MKVIVQLLLIAFILPSCSVLENPELDATNYERAVQLINDYAMHEAGSGSSYRQMTQEGISITSGKGYSHFVGKRVRIGDQAKLESTLRKFCEKESGTFTFVGDGFANDDPEIFTCLVSDKLLFQAVADFTYSTNVSGSVFKTFWHKIELVSIHRPSVEGHTLARTLGYVGPETDIEKRAKSEREAQREMDVIDRRERIRLSNIDYQKRKPGAKLCKEIEIQSPSSNVKIVGNTERAEGNNIQARIASIRPASEKPLIVGDTQIVPGKLVWKKIGFWELCE